MRLPDRLPWHSYDTSRAHTLHSVSTTRGNAYLHQNIGHAILNIYNFSWSVVRDNVLVAEGSITGAPYDKGLSKAKRDIRTVLAAETDAIPAKFAPKAPFR